MSSRPGEMDPRLRILDRKHILDEFYGMKKERAKLNLHSRAQWRAWLEQNHEISPGVWLVLLKGPERALCYDDALEEAICFGWIDSLVTRMDDRRYLRLFTPRRRGSGWSEANRERAVDLIARGLMTQAGMEQVRLAREAGLWYDKPEREFPMPAELEEALELNQKAALFFSELAPSYQRRYMMYTASAVKPVTRRARAQKVVELLEMGEKQAML